VLCQSEGPAATGLVKTSTGVVADDGHSCAQVKYEPLRTHGTKACAQWARVSSQIAFIRLIGFLTRQYSRRFQGC
jgi:hypothetical protein